MQSILKFLPVLLRLSQNNDEMCESACFVAWRATVGDAIARATRPIRLTRKTLIIAAPDETWKKQLEEMSGQILFKLNGVLGSVLVTGLEFQIDPVTARTPEKPPPHPAPELLPDPVLTESASRIEDPELRERFLKTASKYLSSQQMLARAAQEKRRKP